MSYFLGFILTLSLSINIMLVWYVREYIKRIRAVYEELEGFREAVDNYNETLEKLTKMEVYHGEPTIQAIMENTFYLIEYPKSGSSSLLQTLGEDKQDA